MRLAVAFCLPKLSYRILAPTGQVGIRLLFHTSISNLRNLESPPNVLGLATRLIEQNMKPVFSLGRALFSLAATCLWYSLAAGWEHVQNLHALEQTVNQDYEVLIACKLPMAANI